MTNFILALDQGTTSTRAILFDHAGKVVGVKRKEHEQFFPKPGWVEHDALEIWSAAQLVIQGVLNDNNLTQNDLAAIGITNQRLAPHQGWKKAVTRIFDWIE